ncbi:metallophosphoesterase [Psychrobacter sp. GP33]|uniref:metallophosphoesterase n=1 Tax=Psychrobacter sp. GP33 TaxID=2758709 RepID=UPI0015F87C88|nr:metallophosphoesterase [Psychrobacter sp. GP33]
MPTYPIQTLSTAEQPLNVLQITDLHLTQQAISTHSNAVLDDVCLQRFEAVLQQALSDDVRCDLIIVTGDLVDEVESAVYDYIFATLQATNIPFVCIAGNHDVTDEVGKDLPFSERALIAQPADSRLLSRHVIMTDHWQLLFLDSSIPGQVAGEIKLDDMAWLRNQLSSCDKPALLALHHHLLPMNSKWIDAYITKNAGIFWQQMAEYNSQLQVIISGHTHQEQASTHQGITVYSTPSTCYQFKPNEDEFTYDETARPGYRWLQLANNGQVASWVKRLDT